MTSGVGVASKKGRCHPLWQKLLECRDNSLYPRKDCVLAADDYMECLHHRKEVLSISSTPH